MLTWSTWKTEPRSNRYHYASRFARELPVFFVQPWSEPGAPLQAELTEISGIEVIHCPSALRAYDVLQFRQLLNNRRIRFPLLWIYNSLHYEALISAMPQALRVFHATEDFFTPSVGWELDQQATADSVRKQLSSIDLLIAVSEGVLSSFRTQGGYDGPALVAENGCDASFLLSVVDARKETTVPQRERVAVFQGGINKRLDYALLLKLVRSLPDWEFLFCGSDEHAGEDWQSLLAHPNVQYLGILDPAELARLVCSATVGLIPFVQDEWIGNSFPLKALEYVACGLPVVSVPIAALDRFASDIYYARNPGDFAVAMQRAAETRLDRASLRRRRQLAEENSYDRRFAVVMDALVSERDRLVQGRGNRVHGEHIIAPLPDLSIQERWTIVHTSMTESLFRAMLRMLPAAVRTGLRGAAQSAVDRAQRPDSHRSWFERLVYATLKSILPAGLRRRLIGARRCDWP